MTVVLDSEETLFHQRPETLVRVDCRGEVRPGLAAGWTRDSAGRKWVFTLGRGVAAQVVSLWHQRRGALESLGIESAAALDETRLSVTLRATPDSAPRLFAHPALAVSPTRDSLSLSATGMSSGSESASVFDLRLAPAGDPRDAIDQGADLVVTRDPAVVDYVSHRPEFSTHALPWSRTYVLLQSAGTEPIEGAFGVDSLRVSLARDVARADARPANRPFWWSGPRSCRHDLVMEVAIPRAARIVYPRGDEVAKGLAERIVALVIGSPLRAVGLDQPEFAIALRAGGDRGYIVALPRQVAAPCHESQLLPAGGWIQPLIDTRAHAIVRKGVPPLTVDWDGAVRVLEP